LKRNENSEQIVMPRKKRGGISFLSLILMAGLLVALTVIFIQWRQINKVDKRRLRVLQGETLPAFELIPLDNTFKTPVDFSKGLSILICFKSECMCSSNNVAWKNLIHYFGDRVRAYGVIPTDKTTAEQLREGRKFNFPLFIPQNAELFQQQMMLSTGIEKTLLVVKNKVIELKTGTLSPEDFELLITTIKDNL